MGLKYGKVSYEPDHIEVGTYSTWCLRYTVGRVPIQKTGHIRIGIEGRFCCDRLQSLDPEAPNYVSAKCVTNLDVELSVPNWFIRNSSQYWEITVDVLAGQLTEGDVVEVTFGDTSQGSRGYLVRKHAQDLRVVVSIDPLGNGDYTRVPDVPRMPCSPGAPKRLEVIGPSYIKVTEPFRLVVRYVDEFANIVPPLVVLGKDFTPTSLSLNMSLISGKLPTHRIELEYDIDRTDSDTFEVTAKIRNNGKTPTDEFVVITAKDCQGKEGISNPGLLVAESETSPYWGEIHGQTLLSDGQLTPDEYYRYARDRERLDFSAISDHDTHMMRREVGGEDRYLLSPFWEEPLAPWHVIKYETDRFHEPGRFVTLLGYEWTSGHCFTPRDLCFGHRNVYYLAADGRVYSHVDPDSDTPSKLFNRLEGKDALVIPHHSSRPLGCTNDVDVNSIVSGVDWRFHDGRWERLVEIYSKWGNSETHNGARPVVDAEPGGTVQKALAMGCRVGFTGGSDTHACWPGSSTIEEGGLLPYRSGLTCVMATGLTRQEIFSALFDRFCYATTGERIFIDFSVNGKNMGTELPAYPGVKAHVCARIALTSEKGRTEIVRNNEIVAAFEGGKVLTIDWTDDEPVNSHLLKPSYARNDGRPFAFYYLRVIQEDGEMGWASPVWFLGQS